MEKTRIHFLYDQYICGLATHEEVEELTRLLANPNREEEVARWLDEMWEYLDDHTLVDIDGDRREMILNKILEHKERQGARARRLMIWSAAAATVLLTVLTYLNWPISEMDPQMPGHAAISVADIDPGTDRAVLFLADGRQFTLIGYGDEQLPDEPSLQMGGENHDMLVHLPYESGNSGESDNQRYNEIRTPAGGQYRLMLSDGTRVTLNASSRLRYPEAFASNQRLVEFEGEGYFEVVSDASHPFLVRTNVVGRAQDVRVLGTEFNINTYDYDESVVTTVVGGQVAVNSGHGDQILLTSGEKSILSGPSGTIPTLHRQPADINETMAWVDGLFVFNSEPLPKLLNRVSRWYGVTFIFESDLSDVVFQGNYFRNKGLLHLLRNLETAGKVQFKMDSTETAERRIYVKKV